MTDPKGREELAEDLRQAVGDFVRRARTAGAAGAGGAGQAAVLGHLFRRGLHSIADLAALERVRHQSMARTVKNLEAAGLVTRSNALTDRRRVVIEITEAGHARLEQERRQRALWIATAIGSRLTPEEQADLQRFPQLLQKLSG